MTRVRDMGMSALKRVLSAPRRKSRSKGFGIHSPFAFRFVRNVIDQPCAYYAYDTIDTYAGSATERRTLRRLFRIALHFRPATVTAHGHVPDIAIKALNLGLPQIPQESGISRPGLIIAGPGADESTVLSGIGCGSAVIILIPAGFRRQMECLTDRLWAATDKGMLFQGSDMAIFAADSTLPHQRFRLWMR